MDKLGNNHWTTLKERRKIWEIAKFESDLLKTNEDIALQSCESLQKFLLWAAQHTCPTPPYRRLQIFATLLSYIFVHFRRITSKFGSFTNFKTLFTVVSPTGPRKKLKNCGSVYWLSTRV